MMPLPDFSMPFNVITMVCTVLAFLFGTLWNLLLRRPAPVPCVKVA